jgi:small subunit ribosomal protein S3Ae
MAVGKNKKLGKSKKGGSKKKVDPFLKKETYEVRAPTVFSVRSVGKTIATKTQGTKVARDTLLGRIVEVSLGDLKNDAEDEAYRKFKLKIEDVSGFSCLTQFWGMDITADKLRALVRKKQSLIECYADVKTTDNYALRLFAIGFTKKAQGQKKKTSYAQTAQVRAIRKRMREIMKKEAEAVDCNGLVEKLMGETIGKEIEKHTQSIYPLQNVMVRKCKVVRTPKTDAGKLLESHGGAEALAASAPKQGVVVAAAASADVGVAVAPAADAAPAAEAAKPEEKKAAAKPAKKDEGKKAKGKQ